MLGQVSRVLTAVAPDTVERVQRILAGHELSIVHDLEAAIVELAKDNIGVIFVGARFDESRMFDLLDFLRQSVEHRRIPIVAGIIAPTKMSAATIAGLTHTTKLYGASIFINLNDFPDDEVGNRRIRLIVDALIIPPEKIPEVTMILGPRKPG